MGIQFAHNVHMQEQKNISDNIHFTVVLGGDGTLLYLVSLFTDHQHVPPIVCFQRGSLGFLAPFQIENYKQILSKILSENETSAIAVRMRLTARVWRHPDNMEKAQSVCQLPRANHHRSWSKEIDNLTPISPQDN